MKKLSTKIYKSKRTISKSVRKATRPRKLSEIYASHGQVESVRKELKSDIASLRLEMKSGFKSIDARFNELEAKIDAIGSKVEAQTASINRMLALYEEQNNRNKFVLDGYTSLYDQMQGLNARVVKLESGNA